MDSHKGEPDNRGQTRAQREVALVFKAQNHNFRDWRMKL